MKFVYLLHKFFCVVLSFVLLQIQNIDSFRRGSPQLTIGSLLLFPSFFGNFMFLLFYFSCSFLFCFFLQSSFSTFLKIYYSSFSIFFCNFSFLFSHHFAILQGQCVFFVVVDFKMNRVYGTTLPLEREGVITDLKKIVANLVLVAQNFGHEFLKNCNILS